MSPAEYYCTYFSEKENDTWCRYIKHTGCNRKKLVRNFKRWFPVSGCSNANTYEHLIL